MSTPGEWKAGPNRHTNPPTARTNPGPRMPARRSRLVPALQPPAAVDLAQEHRTVLAVLERRAGRVPVHLPVPLLREAPQDLRHVRPEHGPGVLDVLLELAPIDAR